MSALNLFSLNGHSFRVAHDSPTISSPWCRHAGPHSLRSALGGPESRCVQR